MAKDSQQERKQQLIASLQSKRAEMAAHAEALQSTVNPRRASQAVSGNNAADTTGASSATTPPRPMGGSVASILSGAISRSPQIKGLPVIGKLLGKSTSLGSQLSTNLIRKETAKPILIGLGGAFVIVTLLGNKKKRQKQKQAAQSKQNVTKPAVGFLMLKTLLSISEPALKHLVAKGVKNKFK